MKASDIRSTFLKFFESKGHQAVASSPVVPGDDPTLLFTNAGMNQFKDVFLGFDKRPYTRAATAQKCIRAGGKHNDLENVGYTARHHTFFEMLGNFSFGDYFKHYAISFAWELLTEHFHLPKDKLWATVYAEDDEAYDIWLKVIGLPPERIVRIGDNKGGRYMSDNFWMMGDTGPCGPCSEIFYDHGPEVAGGPPGSPEQDGDRYIEIWNNVFMQFNRTEDGTMHRLPKPSVDTGMGLERLAAVLQHVHSNYEIDLFRNLLRATRDAVAAAGGAADTDLLAPSLKVIADHIRACTFTVVDGVIPGNEGRGYVLRRIARRAIRHGYKLGARKPFFHKLVSPLAAEMGDAYPELRREAVRVTEVLKQEEERFFQTIAHGMEILEGALATEAGRRSGIDGETAFKLHDTYGFPLDLTADVCRERGVAVDEAGFQAAMTRQREQARAAAKFKMAAGLEYDGAATAFHGYEHLVCETSHVTALYVDGTPVVRARAGDDVVIVLDHTPFYAESCGQVGDVGELRNARARVAVEDTVKIQASVHGHQGRVLEGEVEVGDRFTARVDGEPRARTMRNHSVTHLMHKALREVLGGHVQQKGSLVTAERTRFDFAHHAPVTDAQIAQVEALVNAEILANAATQARVLPIDEAQKLGRHDAVRREVRRRGARAGHRLQPRAVRRHARAAHRRHRPVQDRRGVRRGRRHPPHRGRHRRPRAGLPAAARRRAGWCGGRTEGGACRGAGPRGGGAGPGEDTGEGDRRTQGQARFGPGRRAHGPGGGHQGSEGAGRHAGRCRRPDPARDAGQAQGQAQDRGHRAGCRGRRQGAAGRRGDGRQHGPGEGR